ncbi:MAG: CDP-diacylglycerol--glycerol-3-phosphate 3-phosphatidyltransferase [Spirochaetaceae bacterium]|nr:CDP-diacylglycerol--glycerol-3-phosphate 3-phosphatidyltransferase [Spirochaetaceae bacterium]
MNLPNKLTFARLCMTPLFFISFNLPNWFGERYFTFSTVLVIILFICIELTDLLDGIIARSRNMVTDLGKVMDPFADTFSRLTYFVCLMTVGIMPVIAFIIIMWREFAQSFIRMLMMKEGKALPANIWGKSKAVLYAVSAVLGVIYLALDRVMPSAPWITTCGTILTVIFYLAAVASVASFLTYIKGIRDTGALNKISR